MAPKPPVKGSGNKSGHFHQSASPGNRNAYFGDRQLARRVEEYLNEVQLPNVKCIDAELVADSLQLQYREYARRKRNAFRKSVQKVCDWYTAEKRQRKTDANLDALERRHLAKKRKKRQYDIEDLSSDNFDSDEDSFSSDNPDYVEIKDTNMANNMVSNLYRGHSGSTASTPANSHSHHVSKTPRSASYPGTPMRNDSDNDSLQLGNVTIDITSDGEETAAKRMKKQALINSSLSTPAKTLDMEETPSTNKKTKKRKTINQTIEDKILEGDGAKSTGKVTGMKSGQRKRKRVEPTQPNASFADVGGNDDSLHEVCKLLVHMRHPEVYQQLGVTPPRGVLLHGPPGCGKTLLAHAIAGELDLPFLKIAATEIVSGVSGESEGNIRDVFEQALALAPCILFIDEIDAITPKRETAQREMERRIVAQLLSCMDDLNSSACHVLVIGATNRVDSLDPALRRAGRFDREISMGIPDEKARKRIMEVLCRNLRLAEVFDFHRLASLTPGYVGADLMALCREASMCAVNRIFHKMQEEKRISRESSEIPDAQGTNDQDNSNQLEIQPMSTSDADTTKNTTTEKSPSTDIPHSGSVSSSNPISGSSDTTGDSPSSKPSYLTVLNWLKDQPPLTEEELQDLCIEMSDFEQALPHVQPSAKREGFATIPDVTWDDVGALEGIREDLTMAILAPVRNPDAFKALGITSPPGILLAGPPGCGKTLLAKAIANESGINFISVKGPELMNMYVGESERAVRQCFQRARNSAPCVIFFDELDALCPRRSDFGESGSSARVVNQLLTEMDGLEARKQVFIMGATNRPDIIDPAVLRPGRMDKIIYVGIPTPDDRVAILKTITKNATKPPLAEDISTDLIGMDDRCQGYTGADLAALVREASMSALKKVIQTIQPTSTQQMDPSSIVVKKADFEVAFAKVKASVSKKDQAMYEHMRVNLLRGHEEEKT